MCRFFKERRDERGITGIETAIILIAFVIVASVFAYVVLSAGMFSTQEAQEAIYAGLTETRSTIELKGDVLGFMEGGILTGVSFTLGHPPNSDPIDFTPPSDNNTNMVIISYNDDYQVFPTVDWTITKLNTTTSDNLLDNNELFQITVDLSCVSENATTEELPGPYHNFRIEVKPPVGAILPIERTVPARIDQAVVNLH